MSQIMVSSTDGQGHKYLQVDISKKTSSQEILMCNFKALALTVQKFIKARF